MHKLLVLVPLLASACVAEPDLDLSSQAIDSDACPPNTPSTIAPAADQDLAFALDATGVQKYACTSAGTWVLVAPEAMLSRDGQAFVHHYAGPTWEWLDGSTVTGKKLAGATVDSTAIAWLLLATTRGPVDGKLSEITTIQRLSTGGGLAPAGACTPGDAVDVPYTATYFFYRTKADHPENNTRCGAL
ncbi:MAG TPA: DUF3455 domain-containing protein [Kofleriaceae bacterium]|nr:DUF3455 domain-containing protein [Kofleriaceae bacterium]